MSTHQAPTYREVVRSVWDEVSIYDGAEAFLAQFTRLPQAVGDLYAAHWVVSEVCNGSFPQLFSNATGVLAPEAVQALRRIGLAEAADALAFAMEYFGEQYPRDRDVRGPMIDWAFEQDLDEAQKRNLALMLEVSAEFLDAIGKDQQRFQQAADAYAARHVAR